MKTKQDVVDSMDRPFEIVAKAERRSPLKRLHPKACNHDRAYKTDAYPTSGPTFVCVDCHRTTDYPADLE